MAGRRISREDALTIFRTWAEDRALLRCECRFANFVSVCDSRVRLVDDEELRCIGDDNRTEFVLRLRGDLVFGYVDMRDPPSDRYVRMVVVFTPFDGDPDDADKFVLGEIIED